VGTDRRLVDLRAIERIVIVAGCAMDLMTSPAPPAATIVSSSDECVRRKPAGWQSASGPLPTSDNPRHIFLCHRSTDQCSQPHHCVCSPDGLRSRIGSTCSRSPTRRSTSARSSRTKPTASESTLQHQPPPAPVPISQTRQQRMRITPRTDRHRPGTVNPQRRQPVRPLDHLARLGLRPATGA
jgi:hypothetical protein